jgi:hypothetical protein
VALILAAPLLFAIAILILPIVIPLAGWSHARAGRRRRLAVRSWPCGWCGFPLGEEALARAEAIHVACYDRMFPEFTRFRMVRDLHACCGRCDAAHRYHDKADRFERLSAREFARTYGDPIDGPVAPATLAMAWPWLPPTPPAHAIALTLDGGGVGSVSVPPAADIAAIGEALLRAPWLAGDGADMAWTAIASGATLTFGRRGGMPFVHRDGPRVIRADAVSALRIHRYREGPAHGKEPA